MADENPKEPGSSGLPRYPGTAPSYPGGSEHPADDWYTPPPTPGGYYPPGSTPPPRAGWRRPFPGGPAGAAPPYAGYWYRVAGAIIDAVIVFIVSLVYLVPAHAFTLHRGTANGHALVIANGSALLVLALGALYAAFLIGLRGQTLGMMAMRIKAIDRTTGELIGFPRALGRDLLERLFGVLFFIPLVIDLLFPAWDPQHQTLHDKAVNSIVVRV